jgi:hypothetical protein
MAKEPKEDMMGKFRKWEVEDALRDLERAEMHRGNPELMEQVAKIAKKKVKLIESLADLKNIKKMKSMEEDEEEGEED